MRDLRNDDVAKVDTLLSSDDGHISNINEFIAVHIDFKLDKTI